MGKQRLEVYSELAELLCLMDGTDASCMQAGQKDTIWITDASFCLSAWKVTTNLNVQLNAYVKMSKPAAPHYLIQWQKLIK